MILSSAFLKLKGHDAQKDVSKSCLKKINWQALLLSFVVQRKAKGLEEHALEQEHILEGLKELDREEKENFVRYGFVFFIIVEIFSHRGPYAIILALLALFYIGTVRCCVAFLPTMDCMRHDGPLRV